jgi:OOP family OmpA-OmpF porin
MSKVWSVSLYGKAAATINIFSHHCAPVAVPCALQFVREQSHKEFIMKRLSLVIALATAGAVAHAEHGVPEKYGYVGIHATQHWFDIGGHVPNPDLDDTLLPGLQAGYRANEAFSLQLWGESEDIDFERGRGEVELEQYFASARFHMHDSEVIGFEPYAGVALGHKVFDSTGGGEDPATVAGPEVGLQRAIAKRLILDLGVRPTYSFDDERWDGQLYAGINLVFGQAEAQAARETVQEQAAAVTEEARETVRETRDSLLDSDGDGIPDNQDQCPDTTAGAKVDDTGCHVMLEHSVNETLNVQFETGGARVKESSIADIERIATVMVEYPETSLVIEGHTDSVGNADFNRRLSQQRADAVKAVLVDRFGIDADRIEAVGKGEDEPVADNGTAEGRAKNRRVETEISASRTEAQYQ